MHRALKLVPPSLPGTSFTGDDVELVEAFLRGDPRARSALYARYAAHVHRVLRRILGAVPDLADLQHDVFVRAITSLGSLADPRALKAWLTMVTVHVARSAISRRRRARWLLFLPNEQLPEVAAASAPDAAVDAVRATYAVLDLMPSDERIAFALRVIDGMELTDVAAACDVSLATLKRRLARAEQRFLTLARRQPALTAWLEGGTRWGRPTDR